MIFVCDILSFGWAILECTVSTVSHALWSHDAYIDIGKSSHVNLILNLEFLILNHPRSRHEALMIKARILCTWHINIPSPFHQRWIRARLTFENLFHLCRNFIHERICIIAEIHLSLIVENCRSIHHWYWRLVVSKLFQLIHLHEELILSKVCMDKCLFAQSLSLTVSLGSWSLIWSCWKDMPVSLTLRRS